MDVCEHCGFDFDDTLDPDEIARRAGNAALAVRDVLEASPSVVGERPSAQRWSMMEYAAHIRDVFLTIRDRIVIGLVEDNPTFKSLHRDERIELGLYRADTAEAVGRELLASEAMFSRLFLAVPSEHLGRVVQYGSPDPTTRTLAWMGHQAVHEAEHHLSDMAENRADLERR